MSTNLPDTNNPSLAAFGESCVNSVSQATTPPPTQAEMKTILRKIHEQNQNWLKVGVTDEGGHDFIHDNIPTVISYIHSLQARVEVLEGEKKRMMEYLRGRSKVVAGALYDKEADILLSSLNTR